MKARAPGKLILSGEHAVVHGQGAIACAINRYVECEVTANNSGKIIFSCEQFHCHKDISLEKLRLLEQQVASRYQQFIEGRCHVTDIVQHPFDVCMVSFIRCFDYINATLKGGVTITLQADLPIGCGLGASAAFINSIIKATSHYFLSPLNDQDHLALALALENLQHGVSSGLDVYASFFGSTIYYHNKQYRPIDLIYPRLQFVNTGQPQCSTGECVSYVTDNVVPTLWPQFNKCTDLFCEDVFAGVKMNHRLLTAIAVVPKLVQEFIATIEERGGAAKICGAGAINGEYAGIVLVVGKVEVADLCQQYYYELLAVAGDANGCQII